MLLSLTTRSLLTLCLFGFLIATNLWGQSETPTAPLFDSLGDHRFPVSTKDSLAQKYIDQGLILHYGFNHTEAVRSFRQAQRLDPDCAMAYWGEALSLGPHINAGMSQAAVAIARDAITDAGARAANATGKERRLIEALSSRYGKDPPHERSLDVAYADAMRKVAGDFPNDPDIQALFAEALMITTAWDYWLPDGSPNETTGEILDVLETTMEKYPRHPGAHHFYIHTVEMRHPERGITAADRMRDLVPQAGHLQHMPSHIYLQIGRYADASLANQKAIRADRKYMSEHGARGMYRISYIPHNAIYLCFSTSMEGRGAASLDAANTVRDLILEDQLIQPGYASLTHGFSLRYVIMARFGMWQKMLDESPPPVELPYVNAIWHYARGMALLRTGQTDSARTQLESLRDFITADKISRMDVWGDKTTRSVLTIAANMLAGEIAADEQNYEKAISLLRKAVDTEAALGYYEPPVWFHPPRQTLGAVLLDADQPEEAEKVYREELEKNPENGWSLFGLHQALKAQGKLDRAEGVRKRFDQAWKNADVTLTSSRI